VEILEKLRGPMDSPVLKVTLISSLIAVISIQLFYVFMNQSVELMEWFFNSGFYLEYLTRILGIYLGLAFLVYAYRKNYTAVFYGLLFIYGLTILRYLMHAFTGPAVMGVAVINLGAVTGIAHSLTILLSPARSNRYLLIYAILTLFTTLAFGNLLRLEIYQLINIIQIIAAFTPVTFIFLVVDEFKKSKTKSTDDLVDQI